MQSALGRACSVRPFLDAKPALLDRVARHRAALDRAAPAGRSTLQRSLAKGQRGWKVQPDGGLIGLGTSPATGALAAGHVEVGDRVQKHPRVRDAWAA